MIIVDIYVPAVDKSYNFSLNEHVSVRTVLLEVVGMIEQKEKITFVGDKSKIYFFDKGKKIPLSMQNSLNECCIKTGDELILV